MFFRLLNFFRFFLFCSVQGGRSTHIQKSVVFFDEKYKKDENSDVSYSAYHSQHLASRGLINSVKSFMTSIPVEETESVRF